jgi:CO dehydrogenase/acetyl-CoA synthase alpha subunit
MSSAAHGNIQKNKPSSPKSKTKEYRQNLNKTYYETNKEQLSEYYKLRNYADLGMDYVKEVFEKYEDKTAKRILRMKRAVNELKNFENNSPVMIQ